MYFAPEPRRRILRYTRLGWNPRQVLHRLEGGGLRGLTFVSLEEVQTLMAAEPTRNLGTGVEM